MEFEDLSLQILIEILLDVPMDQLRQLCSMNLILNEKICRNPDFWGLKYSLYNILFESGYGTFKVQTFRAENEEEAVKKFIFNPGKYNGMLNTLNKIRYSDESFRTYSKDIYDLIEEFLEEFQFPHLIGIIVEPNGKVEQWLKRNEKEFLYLLEHNDLIGIVKAEDGSSTNIIVAE